MQLICPHCGEPVSAEHINIQRLVAVCPACHTLFQFDPPDNKSKRRKIKQPTQLALQESDGHLNIAFRTNFRLERSETFVTGTILSVMFTIMTLGLVSNYLSNQLSILLPIGVGIFTAMIYYWVAQSVYNKTHIDMSEAQIQVSRKPLPNFLMPPTTIELAGVDKIHYEETAISKKEGYDTPRYQVWAETVDGMRQTIVNDVIEEYAVFIAQRLNERLNEDEGVTPDASRLTDDDLQTDMGLMADESITSSKTLQG